MGKDVATNSWGMGPVYSIAWQKVLHDFGMGGTDIQAAVDQKIRRAPAKAHRPEEYQSIVEESKQQDGT